MANWSCYRALPLEARSDPPAARMSFCNECSTKNESDAKFCVECGAKYSAAKAAPVPAPPAPPPPPGQLPPPSPAKRPSLVKKDPSSPGLPGFMKRPSNATVAVAGGNTMAALTSKAAQLKVAVVLVATWLGSAGGSEGHAGSSVRERTHERPRR